MSVYSPVGYIYFVFLDLFFISPLYLTSVYMMSPALLAWFQICAWILGCHWILN